MGLKDAEKIIGKKSQKYRLPASMNQDLDRGMNKLTEEEEKKRNRLGKWKVCVSLPGTLHGEKVIYITFYIMVAQFLFHTEILLFEAFEVLTRERQPT